MPSAEVVVVGETPSLGRSIVDLLHAEGLTCRLVHDLAIPVTEPAEAPPRRVVVVACNESYCVTARRWARGQMPGYRLVVVGARDPALESIRGISVVPLPLRAAPLVALVRELLVERAPEPKDLAEA